MKFTIEEMREALNSPDAKKRSEMIVKLASQASQAVSAAMDAAVVALLRAGVPLDRIEVINTADPGGWRVRERRKTCDCGRAI